MTETTNISRGEIVTLSVEVEGSLIPEVNQVYSIKIEFEVNKISSAKIVILDGDVSTGEFDASSSKTFLPGNEISIKAGYDNENKLLFKGVICEQNICVNGQVGSSLEVICYDMAIKTTVGRKSETFTDQKDSDVWRSIIGNYSGLSENISSTNLIYPQQVQYDTTDWDFIVSRAEANGFIVTTINGKISIQKPDANTTSVLNIEYGNNLLELHANLNAINQINAVKASSWDYGSQELIQKETNNTYFGPGNLSSSKLSEVVGLSTFDLQSPAPIKNDELENWNQAQLVKSNYSKIQGEVKCQGNSSVQIGNYITLSGVGSRFNGDHLVSKVVHDISEGKWISECAIGLSEAWLSKQDNAKTMLPSNLPSGVNGLFTATVKKIEEDPESQFRILVDVPLFNASSDGLWARHSSFYASNNSGAFFMPDIGDEVVVGFLNEDARFPIILGSLYSNPKLKPSEGLNPNSNNDIKAIVSRSGIEIVFDDKNRRFTIITPYQNTIVLDDNGEQIKIQDQNSNHIIMSPDGISLKSQKNISIKSENRVSIMGKRGILLESNADIISKGLNIQHRANVAFSAEGNASASVESSGHLTLKGAMVMIN
ncbi:type VI secretion system tip protein VgrG [Lacinutrix sp. WUR7]|uniref:type VI secretion system tip protein VgrG n=1 Tax=Lacinutrix sp. WUR7 TaxID=2653681 RepID=UPI00193EAE28|nr:type VI secretion system tip protein VgrG [Lacinutrix sp. WUR7]QRM88187.1 type VI secretion system tip protein VgrG [Lacinutrix sp. WUR7]